MASRSRGGPGTGPQEGPLLRVGWKSQRFGGHCHRSQPLPGGAYKKGSLTPTSLEIWTPKPGPPGPPVTAWSFPRDRGKAREVSVMEGEMLPQMAEMHWAEGGFASVVFMGKPRPGGP